MRAEPVSVGEPKKRRGRATATHFPCGHPKTAEHLADYASGPKCRTCKNAQQKAWLAKKAGKSAPPPITVAAIAKLPVPAPHAVAASKWQKQCVLLHFETGQRCSLLQGHEGLHSASGRTFKTGLNPLELGGSSSRGRELDHRATSGAGE